ncbi:IclR family transcriptional regulator [Mangrovibrevibacter kandeliae]|uniref:IclR family transcriptional regulator n=1 Tax=Mangrovibrevibacter kandeliae TaxID=2968473 RepID=UPI0021186575|nr:MULTISPECIES: IclR family transcriptional regulator [unclassified Aurantimonas]MCQ8781614.1 IclR family transcriptional regulator [Aurantimonas sp. CSK15Z-1]MCW4114940.1 IclR family transcriptional regulator [Aurantimonas sp. MSK8Z-1]
MSATARNRTSGIDRSLQVMDILAERRVPMSAYDLAKSAGAPISTIYRLVDELVAREMLSRGRDNTVWLGSRLMRYGLVYRSQLDLFGLAQQEMHRLVEATGETVQICTRDEGMMLVIGMIEGEGHFRVASHVGTRVPLNWTASGRLLLGHLDDAARLAAFAETARPSATGMAETDPQRLATQARADFENRLALQFNASEFSVACIAAPIRNEEGACVATISIVLPDRKAEERQAELGRAVQTAAEAVERSLWQ